MHTFFGKTAKLVEEAKTQSHFQKAILKIGNYLIVMALFLVGIIFLAALFRHESLVATLQFALVLTVAAIPVPAGGAFGHLGGGGCRSGPKRGHRQQAGGYRRDGRHGRLVLGQDRDYYGKPSDRGRG
jgi:hypothetical protein